MTHVTQFYRKATVLLVVIGSLLGITNASAQTVFLTFAGAGNGSTPLTITFTTPITYTIGVTPGVGGQNSPVFVFEIGNNLLIGGNSPGQVGIVSDPTYTRASTGLTTFSLVGGAVTAGFTSGAGGTNPIVPSDMFVYGNALTAGGNMQIGDTFTLAAGTITTASNYTGVVPTSGAYPTFVADHYGLNLGVGSAIPEPSTYAAFAGLGVLGFAAWRRRKSVSTQVAA
jgi:hypothetical protein